jgi:hypothetical protein
MDWAVEDPSRLMALLAVMVGLVLFLVIQDVKGRPSPRGARAEPQDRRDFQ